MFHAFFLSFWSGFCRSWWFFASVERGSGSVKVKVLFGGVLISTEVHIFSFFWVSCFLVGCNIHKKFFRKIFTEELLS